MSRLALVVSLVALLSDCGGRVTPYEVEDDAGHCVLHSGDGYCRVYPNGCDAGPADLTNSALETCTN